MQFNKWLYCCTLLVLLIANLKDVSSQQQAFELPVQLVGFPFIVLSVRLTNFLKKLSYSVSPATYRARNRRQLTPEAPEQLDVHEVENYLVAEFGPRACIFERVCSHYAIRSQKQPRPQLDWPQVIRGFLLWSFLPSKPLFQGYEKADDLFGGKVLSISVQWLTGPGKGVLLVKRISRRYHWFVPAMPSARQEKKLRSLEPS